MLRVRHSKGFSLLEIMVVVAVVGILLAVGVPNIQAWLKNSAVRASADSILAGVQRAKSEAIKGNRVVSFCLPSATAEPDWAVRTGMDCAAGVLLAATNTRDTGRDARIGVGALAVDTGGGLQNVLLTSGVNMPNAQIIFTPLGRVDAGTVPGGAAGAYIDVLLNPADGAANDARMRRLRVVVSSGGQARMCDPAFSTNPAEANYNIMGCEE